MRSALSLVTLAIALVLGGYYLSHAGSLSAAPRRGTAIHLSRRGYLVLGGFWLVLAAFQVVTLLE